MKQNLSKLAAPMLVAALALGGAQAAHADLTLQGAVGLPLNPTAQIPAKTGIRVQGDYFDLRSEGVKFYGLHAAGRIADGLEINGGVSHNSADSDAEDLSDDLGRTGLDIGVKYLFSRESDPAKVRLAVGAGYSRALLNNYHVYGVATKYLGAVSGDRVPVVGHLGLRYDQFKLNFNGGGDVKSSKVSVFGGVEVPITRTGEFAFVGELQSKNSDDDFGNKIPYSASVRYRPRGQGFAASLGFQRQGVTDRSGIFAQLGYTFDTSSAVGDAQ